MPPSSLAVVQTVAPVPSPLVRGCAPMGDEAVARGEDAAAERADRRRFGRRRQPEHDGAQHHEDQDGERKERAQQHLEHFEPHPVPEPVDAPRAARRRPPSTIQNQVGVASRSDVAARGAGAFAARRCFRRLRRCGSLRRARPRQAPRRPSAFRTAAPRSPPESLSASDALRRPPVPRCDGGVLGAGLDQSRRVDDGRRRGRELPGHAQHGDDEQRRNQADEELTQHGTFGDTGVATAGRRAPQPGQGVAAQRRELLGKRRHGDRALARGQRRHQVRPELGEQDDKADVQGGEHDAGAEGAGVELHHRHAGDGAVHDQQHRRRDQDAEAAAGGDRAGRHLGVVAGLQHRRKREQPHQRHHRADDAGGGGEDGAGDDGRHRERARDARRREVQALEQPVDQRRPLDEVAHEHEQRDGDQHVVRHHRVGALHHQVEDLPVGDLRVHAVVGEPAEEHAHPHQRERRGKPEHDAHDDQRQHQEAQVAVGHLRRRRHQDEHHGHHQRP